MAPRKESLNKETPESKPQDQRSAGIPLSRLLRDEGGIRNALEFMGENNSDAKLRRALAVELLPLATKGVRFASGRPEGSVAEKTKHIRQLVSDNPGLSAKQLFAKADQHIIGDMSEGTFRNQVSAAKRRTRKNRAPRP